MSILEENGRNELKWSGNRQNWQVSMKLGKTGQTGRLEAVDRCWQ